MSENLPPLPEPSGRMRMLGGAYDEIFLAHKLREYARTACAPLEARIAELEAALKLADYIVTAFEADAVASDYFRDIHEFREALKGATK